MSNRALSRRSREARAWLLDAMVPLWSHAALDRDGTVLPALDLAHRAPDAGAGEHDPVAASRLATALARIRALDPGNTAIARTLETAHVDTLDGTGSDTLLARSAWLLASAKVAELDAQTGAALPDGARLVADLTQAQVTKLVAGKAFKAAGLLTWLDACLALSALEPGGGHIGRASSLVAAVLSFLSGNDGGLFARAGEPIDVADQYRWSSRLRLHAGAIGAAPPEEAGTLYRFAATASDPSGVAPQSVTPGGTVSNSAQTLRTQAAALVAHLLQSQAAPSQDARALCLARAVDSFDALMDNHLTPEGGWIAQYDADGLPCDHGIETRHADTVAAALLALIDTTAAW